MIARIQIPIKSITIGERYRSDLGDIASLAESIKQNGLIQPAVVDANHRLIAGRRRIAACEMLGWQEIDVVYIEVLNDSDRVILELEENVRREDTRWQDNFQAIDKIHHLKWVEATKAGKSWTETDTARFVGYSQPLVNFARKLAREIKQGNKEVIEAPTWSDALKTLAKKAEDVAALELAKRTLPAAMSPKALGEHATPATIKPTDAPNLLAGLVDVAPITIPLSSMLHHAAWEGKMMTLKSQFQHIICDPPYAIDVSMMQQNNAMENIDRIAETHQVDSNKRMLESFVHEAYKALMDHGFLVMWCDYTMWESLYQWGIDAGFKVQRWPFIWCKTHPCMNNAAQYNTTKNHEPAIIMRKGKALIPTPVQSSWVLASNDKAKEEFKHPFAKPFEVWKPLIEAVSVVGETILDPFAGCGSSTVASLSLNRKALAIEKDATHYPALIENVSRHYRSRFAAVNFE